MVLRDSFGVPLEPDDDIIVAYDWDGNEVYKGDTDLYFHINDELIHRSEIAQYIEACVSSLFTPCEWGLCIGINPDDGLEVAEDWRYKKIYSDEADLYYQPTKGDFVYEDEIEEYVIACMSELREPEDWGYTERIISR